MRSTGSYLCAPPQPLNAQPLPLLMGHFYLLTRTFPAQQARTRPLGGLFLVSALSVSTAGAALHL